MTATPSTRVALFAAIALALGTAGAAAETTTADLVPDDLPITLSGSYLAGRSADAAQDIAAAATFFTDTLKADPSNASLIERVLILRIANGDMDMATELATDLTEYDRRNPLARLTLAADEISKGNLDNAHKQLAQAADAPLARLTAGLLDAWILQGQGKTDEALKRIDSLSGPTWYAIFKQYHHALIADLAGREPDAAAAIGQAFGSDNAAMRVVEAYARIMARSGKTDQAVKALSDFIEATPSHPTADTLLAALKSGAKIDPGVTTVQQGAAEVLYGLGSAIGTDQGTELPAGYLQLANHLDPAGSLTLLALGDLFQGARLFEQAVTTYQRIAQDSDLWRTAEVQIGLCLDALDRTDEATTRLAALVDKNPADLDAVMALGNIYRARDKFPEAAATYSKGIATIAAPEQADWRIFYYRGVSLERSKKWQESEADLKKALDLNPNQPQVLNYLGYSWVDQGLNLDKALDMIKTAVDLRPNDGYIVDSLGWAYFRLGRYQDAVTELERAIELKPSDPVINDHLGDAYWKVGRKRDALFQWMHSRDMGPEKEDLPTILAKIEHGLVDSPAPSEPKPPQKSDNGTTSSDRKG